MHTSPGGFLYPVALLVAGTACAGAGTQGPKELLQLVNSKGASFVYEKELTGAKWTAFLEAVETGQPDWLKLAAAVYPATDGGASTSITLSLGIALKAAPKEVLLATATAVPIEGTCGFPDMEDERTDTRAEAAGWLDARIKSVSGVTGVSDLATRCLNYLRSAKTEVLSPQGPFGK